MPVPTMPEFTQPSGGAFFSEVFPRDMGDTPRSKYAAQPYTETVSSKTISLSDAAYAALARAKRPDESFSDVVLRHFPRRSLLDLCGTMSKEAGEAIAAAIEENRKERMRLRRKQLGL